MTHLELSREQWLRYRKDTPLLLNEVDLERLHGQIETVSLAEIEDIYLPLSRLLNLYIRATNELQCVTAEFLSQPIAKVPYVLGVTGSVAVGKSTTSRVLKALLERWPEHRSVELVTTDSFIFPNAELERHGLLHRKGFPESYDEQAMVGFLQSIKSGDQHFDVPIYSHQHYDILTERTQQFDAPDILIIEGLNLLQSARISDHMDFLIYVDAETDLIKQWFIERFMLFRELAKQSKKHSFFQQFVAMNYEEATKFASRVWHEINKINLLDHILPHKERADLILHKAANHCVDQVLLRKL